MNPKMRRNLVRAATVSGVAAVIVWAWRGMDYDPQQLGLAFKNTRSFVEGMLPPDWKVLPDALLKLVETLRLAIIGTLVGVILALPLSFIAARTAAVPRIISSALKTSLNVLRAIPAYIYAVWLVTIMGFGPFPGAVAIGLSSFVMLAKLFAETLESVHQAPIEAVKAVGGNTAQVLAYGMLPQALPQFLAHSIYAWEINIGTATILGIVGAGGIGKQIYDSIRIWQWRQVTVYVLVLVVTVVLADTLSYQVRRRYT